VILGVIGLSLVPPQLLKIIVDQNLYVKNNDGLMTRAILYLLTLILIGIFDFTKGGLLAVFGQRIVTRLRRDLSDKLTRLPSSYYSTHTSGEITSRIMNDVSNVNSLFADGLIGMFIDCFKIIGILVSIWMFSASLGWIVVIIIPFIFLVTRTFQKRMLKAQVDNLKQLSKVNGHISETMKNIRLIKSFSKERYMEKVYYQRIEDNFQTLDRVNFYDSCYSPIIIITRAVLILAIVLLASDQLSVFGISLGMVAASIELISNLFNPIEALGMEFQNIQKGISGIKRINEFYEEQEEAPKKETLKIEEILESLTKYGLSFCNVTFAYEEGQEIFKNLDFIIPSGTTVTFMGRTGVGKTTLFRLILGLLQPTNGTILLGKASVDQIPHTFKRSIFGYVDQQFQMIHGSVAEQISLKDQEISKEQVVEALKFVDLYDYVNMLDKGVETPMQDSLFSQGQKQLLSIARAIVMNPPILLLDEITANLDSQTEVKIVTVLKKAKHGRTVLSISHRSTSILDCDMLINLEGQK
jgi:ATP-binding cassette subfamily B protein